MVRQEHILAYNALGNFLATHKASHNGVVIDQAIHPLAKHAFTKALLNNTHESEFTTHRGRWSMRIGVVAVWFHRK